jgi:hypothetical protein
MLRKILSVDPEGDAASTLLPEASSSDPEPPPQPQPATEEDQFEPLSATSLPLSVKSSKTRRRHWIPAAILVLAAGAVLASLPALRSNPTPAPPTSRAPEPVQPPKVEQPIVPVVSEELPAAPAATVSPVVATSPPAPVNTVPARRPDMPPAEPIVLAASGRLAINSPTSVDIYRGNQYVGSTPLTIDLSPGAHAFEYRHAGMQKTVMHTIRSSETTTAMITFDVRVQINARPWANVFLDGTERKPMGQTPMSGVAVPIGGVLVFENPMFEPKRYRVTGRETAIQIVFP